MDRLISLEPSNLVPIRIQQGQKCYGEVTLHNVMYTMPVAFKLQSINRSRYTIRPQSGIISPLNSVKIEIIYNLPQNTYLPESYPYIDDAFQLHSVVVPGATVKDSFGSVPNDWFTNKKKQVFIDSALRVMFVGPLILAQLLTNGSMDEIRDVLEKSDPKWRSVDSSDLEGQTMLHLAIAQGRPDLVQLLLEFEPDVDSKSRSGLSPLEAACASGEALIVELLLARKASTDRSESSTWGPIHLAAAGGHIEVLKLLLLKGANVDTLTKDGNTALHLAVEEGRRDCARQLLASGACPDIQNNIDADTPLHISAALGDEHMVKILLQNGANKDVRNTNGKTPYNMAAESGHNRLFDVLRLGDSLSVAARKGEVRKIQRLLENGANINGRDQNGMTALHRASFKGKIDAIRLLIEKGIDINIRDEEGYTAVHCAVEAGHADVVEFLAKKGADVEGKTNKGVTPVQIAESLGYTGITRILVSRGAYRNGEMKGKSNLKPIHTYESVFKKSDKDIEKIKKKPTRRSRGLRSSFDWGSPLVVL